MTIDFQFTLEDYRDAFRAHFKKGASLYARVMFKVCAVGGCLLMIMGVALFATGERRLNVWLVPAVLGAVWFWIGIGGSYNRAGKAQFEIYPSLRQARRLEIGSQGINTDAGIASSNLSWNAYLRYVESDKVFLLYTAPGCFVIIPKRVLQPSETDELRQALQTHIGKIAAVAVA
jgi:hypothetical protein